MKIENAVTLGRPTGYRTHARGRSREGDMHGMIGMFESRDLIDASNAGDAPAREFMRGQRPMLLEYVATDGEFFDLVVEDPSSGTLYHWTFAPLANDHQIVAKVGQGVWLERRPNPPFWLLH